jgi:hypothetical protein
MYPLWEELILPVLEASGARRMVEIGALRGQTTAKMVETLGEAGELHVIDPVPIFDPSELERRFAGAYHFHRATSHDVLPGLPAMDAALIDGDHNWYTVHRELELLAETARSAGAALPLLIMHDVGWPYGRRDLYYEPERIPEEFRQPYAMRGMSLGRADLAPRGGINATHYNALREGGERNGVRTALEDFTSQYDRDLRTVIVPTYYGLAFVAEEERLADRPELARAFDRLESTEYRAELLEFAERLRLKQVQSSHALINHLEAKNARAVRRYLDRIKAELAPPGASAEPFEALEGSLDTLLAEKVEGDFVDLGADERRPAFLRAFLEAHEVDAEVLTASGSTPERVALLATGPEVAETLEALYDRVAPGGFVLVDDYGARKRRKAADRFRAKRGVAEPMEQLGAAALWRKLDA